MDAILYIGHGTRSKTGATEVVSFLNRIIGRVDVPIQEISFLELTEPSIEEGFIRCVERGATTIIVVPIFLLAAGHIKEDIPLELSRLSKKYPHIKLMVKDPFGLENTILDGIAEFVKSSISDLNAHDSLLLVGRGSSDPGIYKAFDTIMEGIQNRLNVGNVSVCYLAAAEPRFKEGLESISQKAVSRVVVIPYLLFPGLLLSEISNEVMKRQGLGQQILHTGPLSKHRAIEDLIIQKALESSK